MRAVVQLVRKHPCRGGRSKGENRQGVPGAYGIEENDTEKDLSYICEKLLGLRVLRMRMAK